MMAKCRKCWENNGQQLNIAQKTGITWKRLDAQRNSIYGGHMS